MQSNKKFGIRPFPKPGESFTGYMVNVAIENAVLPSNLINATKRKDVPESSRIRIRSYLLDLFPSALTEINQLASFLNKSVDTLRQLSFSSVMQKFHSADELMDVRNWSRTNVALMIEKERRKFCPQCLMGGRGFQLLWQVTEIHMCDVHHTTLISECSQCMAKQPYIADHFGLFRCKSGRHDLRSMASENVHADEVDVQLRIYEDWRFLTDPETVLLPNLEALSKKECLAILLLYVTQGGKGLFSVKTNTVLPIGLIYKFRDIICGRDDKSISLKQALGIIRKTGISLKQAAGIAIPPEFVSSIRESFRDATVCLTPWCESSGSDKNLIRIPRRTHTLHKGVRYNSNSVCKSCWMSFGFDMNDRKWKPIGDTVEITRQVRSLLLQKSTLVDICRRLEITKDKLYKIVGYLVFHKLLSEELLAALGPKKRINDDGDVVGLFRKMGSTKVTVHTARKMYGWDFRTFSYYIAHPDVQKYLLFDRIDNPRGSNLRKFSKQAINPDELREKVLSSIEELRARDRTITRKEVAGLSGVALSSLTTYGLNQIIKDAAKDQLLCKRKQEEKRLIELAIDYVRTQTQKGAAFTAKEVAVHLGIKANKVTELYPELAKWLITQVKDNQRLQKQEQMEYYKLVAEIAIKEAYQNGNVISHETVCSEYLQKNHAYIWRYYREVIQHMWQVKEQLPTPVDKKTK